MNKNRIILNDFLRLWDNLLSDGVSISSLILLERSDTLVENLEKTLIRS